MIYQRQSPLVTCSLIIVPSRSIKSYFFFICIRLVSGALFIFFYFVLEIEKLISNAEINFTFSCLVPLVNRKGNFPTIKG